MPAIAITSDSAAQDRPGARGRPTFRQLAVGLVVLGLIWRAFLYLLGIPIWGDESFVAIDFIRRDFAGMFEPLTYGQICPLLYMWAVEAVSRVAGYSEWSLRFVAFAAGVTGLLLFVKWSRQVLPRSAWFCAVGFFAASYFIARHSTEVKPYATDLLVSLVLLMLGWRIFKRPRSVGRWIVLVVLAVVAPWASYPSMFIGGAVGLLLTLGLMRSRFHLGYLIGLVLFGVALCGSSLWMYQVYAKLHAAHSSPIFELESWSSTFPPITEPWRLPMWFLVAHTGNMFAYPQGGQAPGSIATFLLFVVGCMRLWKKNRPLLLLLVAPFVLTFIAAAMKAYPYGGSARVAQYLAPAICVGAGLGLSVILRRLLWGVHLRRAFWITAILLALIPTAAMARRTFKPFKSEKSYNRYASVQWAIEKTQPGDRWVVFNAVDVRVSHAPWMGDWKGVGAEFLFNVMRSAPVPVAWSPPPEEVESPPDGKVIVLVYYAHRLDKVDFPEDLRDAYIAKIAERLGPARQDQYLIGQASSAYEALQLYLFE